MRVREEGRAGNSGHLSAPRCRLSSIAAFHRLINHNEAGDLLATAEYGVSRCLGYALGRHLQGLPGSQAPSSASYSACSAAECTGHHGSTVYFGVPSARNE